MYLYLLKGLFQCSYHIAVSYTHLVCAHILWIAANGVNELIQLLLNIFFILQHDIGKSNAGHFMVYRISVLDLSLIHI